MKIGIVGSGGISTPHLTAASRYPGAQLVGIADRDIALARAQAAKFAVPHALDNLADLLNLQPDIVHVLTPPDSHESLVLQALAGGAHVYVEKPMAITEAACANMAAAAARAGRQLCVGHSYVFTPGMQQARALLRSGAAGEIVQAAATFNYDVRRNLTYGEGHWTKQLPGGLAEDLAVHPAALLISVLGSPQQTLAFSRGAPGIPDGKAGDVAALLDAELGLGTLSVSLRARPDMILLDIRCTKMMLRLNLSSMSLTIHRERNIPRKIDRLVGNIDVGAQLIGGTVGSVWKVARKKLDTSYGITPLVHAFYDAIKAGEPAPVGPAEGKQLVAVMRAIWPQPEAVPGRMALP